MVTESGKGLDENQRNLTAVEVEDGAALSSPNSTVSSFQMDFSIYTRGKRDANEVEADRGASSKASDEEENGMARKKLRLSKEQSAFLEESFKEHNTLNPVSHTSTVKPLSMSVILLGPITNKFFVINTTIFHNFVTHISSNGVKSLV